MRENELFVKEMFRSHSAVMFLLDPDNGKIIDANPAAERFYGYPYERLLNMAITDLTTHPPDKAKEIFCAISKDGVECFSERHRLSSGLIKYVEVRSTVFSANDKKLLFAIITDISDKVRIENELKLLNRKLTDTVEDEINKRLKHEKLLIHQSRLATMGEMLGAIAHQWRQPLNVLSILFFDLKDAFSYGELTSDYFDDVLGKANTQIGFMSKTIDDFRNYFKPNKEKVVFDLKVAIDDAVMVVSPQLEDCEVNVDTTGNASFLNGNESGKNPENLKKRFYIYGYPSEFKQVIVNLINNSNEAIAGQRVSKSGYRGKISIRLAEEDKKVFVEISDNGGGIPESILNRIFEPYFSTKYDSGGTGIGLYMSKVIIENHMNAKLYARNGEHGASFIMEFDHD
jgi:PAS domain S-box-containing protein